MRSAAILLLLMCLPSIGLSTTRHVPDDHSSIQDAIIASVNGDVIVVSNGTYVENIDFLGKAISVVSLMGPELTVIDGNSAGSVALFVNGESPDAVLAGFTVTNGTGRLYGIETRGGGIVCDNGSSPALVDNIISGNAADEGGGIFCREYASPAIFRNRITLNTAVMGGGIYCDSHASPSVMGNTISENQAGEGGGLYCHTTTGTVSNNTFEQNQASRDGGGIFCDDQSDLFIKSNLFLRNTASSGIGGGLLLDLADGAVQNNIFFENEADQGGGMACHWCAPSVVVQDNRIHGNLAETRGGGIDCFGYPGGGPTLLRNLIYENGSGQNGGGIHSFFSDPKIQANTLSGNTAENRGGGIYLDGSSATVKNMILWRNTAPEGPEIYDISGYASVTYSDVRGGWTGTGNINADPLFVDRAGADFHLSQDPCQPGIVNPCRDAGDPGSPVVRGSTRTDGYLDSGVSDMGLHYPPALHVPGEYATIQGAINIAQDFDTVLAAAGTYVENLDFLGKALTVKADCGPEAAVINGSGSGSVVTFQNGEWWDSVLDGFTLTNGKADEGGGVHCTRASPSILGNHILENRANRYGGGIYCASVSLPILQGNTISKNVGWLGGGGIGCYEISFPQITGNTLLENDATIGGGGGIDCNLQTRPDIGYNVIKGNTAGFGGGINCYYSSSPVITGNTIQENAAILDGGGIHCYRYSSPIITSSVITGNQAMDNGGGGIYCSFSTTPVVINNTLAGNSAGNEGGGIGCHWNSSMTVANTILWDNAAPVGPEIWIGNTADPSVVSIQYSDVDGGSSSVHVDPGCTLNWLAGMISADPLFGKPARGNFHLRFLSPCIDAGDNNAPFLPEEDVDGDARVLPRSFGLYPVGTFPPSGVVDMGADEYALLKWSAVIFR